MDKNLLSNLNSLDKSYLTKFIGISNEMNKSDLSFKNQSLEDKFDLYNLKKNFHLSKLFCIFVVLAYLVSIGTNLMINNYKYVRPTYLLTFGMIFEILCTIVTYYSLKNFYFKCHFCLKYLRFSTVFGIYMSIFIFPLNSMSAINQIRGFYFFIIYHQFSYYTT